ncbi:hypothetical protein [Amycolatopsis sp. NPDC051071]
MASRVSDDPKTSPAPDDVARSPWLACRFCFAGSRPHGAQVK